MTPTIVWLHNDYRLRDNPALYRAAEIGPVIPVMIWAPEEEGDWAPGGAHRWWIHHSLSELAADLKEAGSGLVVRSGASLDQLRSIAAQTGAARVFWNQRYEPALRDRDLAIEASLHDAGLQVNTFHSALLHDPDELRTNTGDPYRVFTPFWKKLRQETRVPMPLGTVTFRGTADLPESVSIDRLNLLPQVDWAADIRDHWTPGERGAHDRLGWFVDAAASSYETSRNRPDIDGTSMLSPYLRYGEISPRQIWHSILESLPDDGGAWSFLRELGWREFSYHLIYHYPHTTSRPLNERFQGFPWANSEERLHRWQRGRTGYPIVDAGMSQLWRIGWMHNRVRMLVASFLTKDLLVPWQEGARWFWDTLVDGDLANNTAGWQWTAGSGADAQPYFRIFNPVSQGKKFDPDGAYVRTWIPELRNLPAAFIHCPWEAPADILSEAGVALGSNYPEPIVDHSDARKTALRAYEGLPA